MISALTLIGLAIACGDGGRVDDILALTGDAAAGATVYADNCASCHGDDGTGGSGPDISGESETEEIAQIVLDGEGDMPAFDGDLTDQEIADVVAFVAEGTAAQ